MEHVNWIIIYGSLLLIIRITYTVIQLLIIELLVVLYYITNKKKIYLYIYVKY